MTTLTIKLTPPACGHLSFVVTGAKSLTVPVDLAELSQPISDEDAVAFLKVIARMAKNGRTIAQARTLLQAGVTVTV